MVMSALLVLVQLVYSEYRVFELKITNTKTKEFRYEISTLDQYQYQGYLYLNRDETIELKDTWMCWKRGDQFKLHCRRPVVKADELKAKNLSPLADELQKVID